MKKDNNKLFSALTVVILFIFVIGFMNIFSIEKKHKYMSMDEMQDSYISMKDDLQKERLMDGMHRCCLEKPCVSCLEKKECDCLDEIMNGKHPCGECIGEILEGHGNKFLAKYFATAIADNVGIEHLETLKSIISDMYDISIEEQV